MCNVLQFQIEAAMLYVWLLMTSLAQLARWGVSSVLVINKKQEK